MIIEQLRTMWSELQEHQGNKDLTGVEGNRIFMLVKEDNVIRFGFVGFELSPIDHVDNLLSCNWAFVTNQNGHYDVQTLSDLETKSMLNTQAYVKEKFNTWGPGINYGNPYYGHSSTFERGSGRIMFTSDDKKLTFWCEPECTQGDVELTIDAFIKCLHARKAGSYSLASYNQEIENEDFLQLTP
jgi:hypothetical protein